MLVRSGHQNGFSIVPRRFSYFIRREIIALRIAVATIWFALCAATMISFSAAAQDIPPLSPELHPWGKFEPGAWKRIHVVAETFNEQGTVASTNLSDSKITLYDIDDESLTLETQVCVEIAGKRFDSEPQLVKQGFHGETLSPNLKLKESIAGQLEIEERKIPCQVLKFESTNGTGKTTTTIYYSATVAPNILKRESKTTDLEGKTALSETTATLLSLDMPALIQGEIRMVSHLKTVQKSPKGTVITLAVICPEIPGGIISHSSKELDANGRLVRRSTQELIDYGSEPEKDRSGIFGRKRANKHRTR
jgi:hypothetical protein